MERRLWAEAVEEVEAEPRATNSEIFEPCEILESLERKHSQAIAG